MTPKNRIHQRLLAMAMFQIVLSTLFMAYSQSGANRPTKTQIVLLGTGHPVPDPDRSGPATAIIVNETPYLIDFGAGVVRRAAAAAYSKGVKALNGNIKSVFVTHLHSDHTIGYPDLIYWYGGARRGVPLEVYGPTGIKAMTEHILEAYRISYETHRKSREILNLERGYEINQVNAHEISAGMIYKDTNVTVTAFQTKHDLMESYGFRFDTPDRSVVVSGDTTP